MIEHASNPSTVTPCAHGGTQPRGDADERVQRLSGLHREMAEIHAQMAEDHVDDPAEHALMDVDPMMSVTDLSELFNVAPRTVRRWRSEQKLPPALTIGGVVRWRRQDVFDWIAERIR